jgi:hypothetical protein
MTEDFVRHVNGSWCIREFSPIRSALVRRDRHAVINEAAFRAFVLARRSAIGSSSDLLSTEIDEFLSVAITELLVDPQWTDKVDQFDEYERPQAIELCWRLNTFFTVRDSGDLVLFPQFKGCGLLDGCAGDVLVGNTLYEVKAGGRFFRSIDLRRLLVYSMLYPYPAKAGCPTIAGRRRTRAAPAGMAPALSWS